MENLKLNLNPYDKYFVRFTSTPESDMRTNSFLKLPNMEEPIELEGICAFELSQFNKKYELATNEEMIEKLTDIYNNTYKAYGKSFMIFSGNFISENMYADGCVVEVKKLIYVGSF